MGILSECMPLEDRRGPRTLMTDTCKLSSWTQTFKPRAFGWEASVVFVNEK